MKKTNFAFFFIFVLPTVSVAGDNGLFPSSKPEYKSDFQLNMEAAKTTSERLQREKTAEDMRDKTHDGILRHQIDKNQSIGIDGSGVNYIRSTQ